MLRTHRIMPSSLSRRHALYAAASLWALASSRLAQAQPGAWPTRPVRLVVAFPPGGLIDVMARQVQPLLSEALGQPVLVENRAGAAGNVAAQDVLSNGGDGHSFLISVTTTVSVNPLLFASMPFDPRKDLQPVGLLGNSQIFLITRPSLPVQTLPEFLALARAKAGGLNYASPGTGTTPHLAAELLKHAGGFAATHVPYRGVMPALQDVMGGQADFMFAPGTVFPAVKAGQLKLLAVASPQRSRAVPSAPTFAEHGLPGVTADSLFGVFAPAGMPTAAVTRLNHELNRATVQPAVRASFLEQGGDAQPVSPAELKALIDAEAQRFGDIVRRRGIRAE